MSAEQTRQTILARQRAGNFSDHQIVRASGYTGYGGYKKENGTNPSLANIEAIQSGLDTLEEATKDTVIATDRAKHGVWLSTNQVERMALQKQACGSDLTQYVLVQLGVREE